MGPLGETLGLPATDAAIERWRRQSGARTVRAVRPGTIVTTEFNTSRLTVDIDDTGHATRVACG